jgi:hypothetical protein
MMHDGLGPFLRPRRNATVSNVEVEQTLARLSIVWSTSSNRQSKLCCKSWENLLKPPKLPPLTVRVQKEFFTRK